MASIRRLLSLRTSWAVLTLMAAYALLLPVYAPLIDPYYAERIPGHGHMYLDGNPGDHTHVYEAGPSGEPEGGESERNFVPLHDSLAIGSGAFVLPIVLSAIVIAPVALGLCVFLSRERDRAPRGIAFSPDPPPPRQPAVA